MDAKQSMVSSILRLFTPAPAAEERNMRRSDDERRLEREREPDRKPADAIDAFVWSWQFPGQW